MAYVREALGLFAAWIVFIQVRNWYRWKTLRRWGAQNGCGDEPQVPNILPGGIERYGLLLKGLKDLDFLEDIIRARYKSMGTHTYRIFGLFNNSIVSTAEPENVQAILATQFNDFDLGAQRKQNFSEVLGNGIFTAERKEWSHYRHQLKPQFARDQVSDLEAAERHLNILFKALPGETADGWVMNVDLLPLIYNFTMDVSTEFLFGKSVDSQTTALHSEESGNTKEQEENTEFAHAMNFVQEYIAWRFRLQGLYWLASSKEFKHSCKVVKDFAMRFVKMALESDHKRPAVLSDEKKKYILLDELVEETRDPIELRDQVLQVLLAGRDTTSGVLCWIILLLARHPQIFNDLRATVLTHFGTESSPLTKPDFSSMKACAELTHVLYETLRLYPLIPINARVAQKDTTLPTGGGKSGKQKIVIRKGETVGYAAYVMHRRKDIWGEDADEFRPERWRSRKLGWEMIGFSGGPRVCLGQQYALTEASFVLVKLLQKYDRIEALDMTGPLKKALTITLSPGDGVKVRMHRASE